MDIRELDKGGILLERGKTKDKCICVSGETIEGVYYRYTSEYLRWNIMRLWAEKTVNLNEQERHRWFIDNPEPAIKFKEV